MEITRIHERHSVRKTSPTYDEYLDAKAAADLANERLKIAQSKLLAEMQDKHQKSLSYTRNGVKQSVTFVQSTNVEIDEKGLRRALTAKIFDKYTVKKLDKKAMEAAMESGDVDPQVVSKFVTPKVGSPFLRFTEKVVGDEEESN